MSLDAGARLGPYEIVAALGAGGMGEVYKARDTRLGRDVALKILPRSIAGDPERLARFEQEARSASALNHPNIVTIYEIGSADGVAFIAMEYVDGETVGQIVAAGPVPTRRALQIAAQAAEGLAKAHAAGIVHRDLKPENLMVSRDGYVKILDFGLAKLVASQREDLTSAPTLGGARTGSGVILGTIGYMSPEQASGLAVDFRSDQFSFGSVLYEMVTGRKAFRAKTSAETLAAIIREEPTPIGSIDAGVPAPLCWIVERCLSKDPDDRYASTRDLVRDIATVRERVVDAPGPAVGAEARPSGLPAARTRFVGRDRERAAVSALLQREDVRLLTLTGPGGIGKSRLALEVAANAADRFPGGVHYLGLAPVADPSLIPSAISRALGLREGGRSSPTDALMDHLRRAVRAPTLLVADGFEHLVAAAPVMADLVAAGPNLKVLVTSRSPLHVYGENEFPVPAMSLVDPKSAVSPEAAMASEAVALFAHRAAAVRPDFAVTAENAAAVAEICARLDGLPLAIELAASRVRLLSPTAICVRLEKRLALLTGGARDLPARQQTLRGAIDWSHDLLDPAEQKLFRRLGVFAGGCTLEAAEAVCNARNDLGVDVMGGMEAMVDRSLLQRVEHSGGEPRFTMLETIREYALEQLAASGDEALMRKAHAAYCLVLAEEQVTDGPESPAAEFLERFEAEHDNFRAALDHLTRSGNAEWGLRLGAALFRFWEMREHLAEGSDRLQRLLALPGASARIKARARALFAAGVLAGEQGDYDAAVGFLEESLAIERERNDGWGIAVTRNALAVILLDRGDVGSAAAHFEENAALWRELGDRAAVARSISNLARAATAQGDFAKAHALHDESIAIFRELGDRTGAAWALDHQADVARERGDLEAAQGLCEKSLAEFREIGDPWGIAGTLTDLGNLARIRSDFARARSLYGQSLEMFRELGHKRGMARLLEGFVCCAASEGEPYAALRLAGAAGALREALGTPLSRAERAAVEAALACARRGLTDTESAGAWMQGWGMPLEDAVALAIAASPASSDSIKLPRPTGR
jgi:predicted ATPase